MLLSLVSLWTFALAQKPALPPVPLNGGYRWNQNIVLQKTMKIELGEWDSPHGQQRRQELRRQGYRCLRRSKSQFYCSLTLYGGTLDEELWQVAERYYSKISLNFLGPFSPPQEGLDTSTEREWWVRGPYKVDQSKLDIYKWVYHYDTEKIRLVFPVGESQPIPWVFYHSVEELRLPVTIQEKDTKSTQHEETLEKLSHKITYYVIEGSFSPL